MSRAPSDGRVATVRLLFTPEGTSLPAPVTLPQGVTTIGRGQDCGIVLEDSQTSRLHAKISLEDGALKITDASTNGTFVDGCRITKSPLDDGDVIRAGDSLLLVRMVPTPRVREAEAHGLLGDAPVMHELRRTLSLVALSDATALVTGESGTGKELIARAIHRASRPEGPFIAVNCGAIAESVAESQLFGHVAGSFTGAHGDHPGFFRAAQGGVLFLDEVGELPAGMQTKLLRVLEERAVIPVGAVKAIPFDVRVVAATNRELPHEVEGGRFRRDLYARLADITLRAPPLRDRVEDVIRLMRHALGPDAPPLTADLAEGLLLHEWPYNVRELMKVAAELKIRGRDLPALELSLVAERLHPRPSLPTRASQTEVTPSSPPPRSEEKERPVPTAEELVALLREHQGSIADVARATGRSRKQVYRWLETHGIDLVSFRPSER